MEEGETKTDITTMYNRCYKSNEVNFGLSLDRHFGPKKCMMIEVGGKTIITTVYTLIEINPDQIDRLLARKKSKMADLHRHRDKDRDTKSFNYDDDIFSENRSKRADQRQKGENKPVRSKVATNQSSPKHQPITDQSTTTIENKKADQRQKGENKPVRSKVATNQSSPKHQPITDQSTTTMENKKWEWKDILWSRPQLSMDTNNDKEKTDNSRIRRVSAKEATLQTTSTNNCAADCHEALDDSLLAETKCGHFFHIFCLLNLLQKTDKCPSCHQPISASEGWSGRHIPCGKTVDKNELLWNDVQHLWMHKDCRFSRVEVLHLTNPDFMRSADNPSSSSTSVTDKKGAYAKPRDRTDIDSRGSSEKKKSAFSEMDYYDETMMLRSFGSDLLNVPPKIGTSGRMTVKPVVPEPDIFDKISTSLNSFDSDFFNEPLTIEHRPLFESTDEFDLPNENSEQSKNNEDVCKFCDERFDSSHQPTTVTICGHLLHTHCMNKYLPTKKKCPVCDHAIKWVDVTNKCVFCLEPFNWNGDMYVNLPCAHKSHQNCHKLWMCTTNDCPICKETIYSRDGCSVCLKPVLPSQIKRKSKCGHEYHAKCSSYQITESDCRTCDRINGATSVTCTICFDYIKKETKSKPISCKHEFHKNCLNRWLQNKTNCPLCRSPIE